MTKASALKAAGNSIKVLEKDLLYRNPVLKEIFKSIQVCESFPITISRISFDPKTRMEKGMLMLGDAAGMIAPLCGNGMSIALHSASIAANALDQFLKGAISRAEMEQLYTSEWKKNFAGRMRVGRFIQRFFGSNRQSDLLVRGFQRFPFLAAPVVKLTHGQPF